MSPERMHWPVFITAPDRPAACDYEGPHRTNDIDAVTCPVCLAEYERLNGPEGHEHECRGCGERFDLRDVAAVLWHEHHEGERPPPRDRPQGDQ